MNKDHLMLFNSFSILDQRFDSHKWEKWTPKQWRFYADEKLNLYKYVDDICKIFDSIGIWYRLSGIPPLPEYKKSVATITFNTKSRLNTDTV